MAHNLPETMGVLTGINHCLFPAAMVLNNTRRREYFLLQLAYSFFKPLPEQ
jgi:hypothetical protein